MSQPTNPFNELTHAFERMQEQFEEIARSWGDEQFELEPSMAASVKVDLEDTEDELVLTAELPGFDPDDIDVRVTDRTLRLEAEYEESEEEEGKEFIRRERHRASTVRSISLPEPVETDDISASYNNGILTVRMPKSEPVAEGTEIDIS
ncbi:MAG: Hsp20/alpha crystallin family protein [Haloarculaceae archaeon]